MEPGEVAASKMERPPAFLNRRTLLLVAACASPLVVIPAFEYLDVTLLCGGLAWLVELLLALLAAMALPVVAVSGLLLLSRTHRRGAARVFIATALLPLATLGGIRTGGRARMLAFSQLAERSQALIQAIKAYEARYGTPPINLEALVPEFLPSVPQTGMASCPKYEYHVGEYAAGYYNNPWVLVVPASTGLMNWDQFMYFPLQNYPRHGYGGWLERVRDWAYVHE